MFINIGRNAVKNLDLCKENINNARIKFNSKNIFTLLNIYLNKLLSLIRNLKSKLPQ